MPGPTVRHTVTTHRGSACTSCTRTFEGSGCHQALQPGTVSLPVVTSSKVRKQLHDVPKGGSEPESRGGGGVHRHSPSINAQQKRRGHPAARMAPLYRARRSSVRKSRDRRCMRSLHPLYMCIRVHRYAPWMDVLDLLSKNSKSEKRVGYLHHNHTAPPPPTTHTHAPHMYTTSTTQCTLSTKGACAQTAPAHWATLRAHTRAHCLGETYASLRRSAPSASQDGITPRSSPTTISSSSAQQSDRVGDTMCAASAGGGWDRWWERFGNFGLESGPTT